jgi:hypothetical protein
MLEKHFSKLTATLSDGQMGSWAVGLKCRFERLKLQHQAKVFPSISDK